MTYPALTVRQKNIYRFSGFLVKPAFSVVFALLMAISANAFIYLPFTPVPVTLQVLTVIFSALTLGGSWALASQILYISMGLAGLPVFAGFLGGPAVFTGPTGGYIIGFALAAFLAGSIFRSRSVYRALKGNGLAVALVSGILGLMVIYIMGGIHLFGFLNHLYGGEPFTETIRSVWIMGISPFIIPDAVKVAAAVIILRPGINGYEDN